MIDDTTVAVALQLSLSNEQIRDLMAGAKGARERQAAHVVAIICGHDDDSRELWEIPEVRAFCRRLVSLGLISYLDYTSRLDPRLHPRHPVRAALGALEVWLISENRWPRPGILIPGTVFEEFGGVLHEANKVADRALGPMTLGEG